MRNYLAIATILLSSSNVWGQTFSTVFSTEFKETRDLDFWAHLYSDPSSHYVLFTESTDEQFTPILQKYDRAFNLGFSQELEVGEHRRFAGVFYARQKFIMAADQTDTKAKIKNYYATVVGLDGKSLPSREVASIPYKTDENRPLHVTWRSSEDTSKILLADWASEDIESNQTELHLTVMDNQLQRLWSRMVILPYIPKQYYSRKVAVSNDGQVFIYAKIFDLADKNAKPKKRRLLPSYQSLIFRFSPDQPDFQTIKLGPVDKTVSNTTFRLTNAGQMFCVGLYSSGPDEPIEGLFFKRVNEQTGAVEVETQKVFTKEEIAGLTLEKTKSKVEGLHHDFTINWFVFQGDGSVLGVAEYISFNTTTTTNAKGIPIRNVHYYTNGEALLLKIQADGAFKWTRQINKKQRFIDTKEIKRTVTLIKPKSRVHNFNGYSILEGSEEGVYIFYNEDKDQIGEAIDGKARLIDNFKDATIAAVQIKTDGQLRRKAVSDAAIKANALLLHSYSRQISSNEMFFISSEAKILGTNKIRMGVVRVD